MASLRIWGITEKSDCGNSLLRWRQLKRLSHSFESIGPVGSRELFATTSRKKSRRDGTLDGFRYVGLLTYAPSGMGRFARCLVVRKCITSNKKTDVAEPPEGFRHVGLLFIAPSGSSRIAL